MADVVFDNVVGEVQDGRGPTGGGQSAAPSSSAPPIDEGTRARMRTELKLLARRESRVRAS